MSRQFKNATAVAVTVLVGMAAPAHASTGAYLDSASWDPIGALARDSTGIPVVQYPAGVEHNPVTVAQWGLQNWSWWTQTDLPRYRKVALKAARWLLANQRPSGAWVYTFDYNVDGTPQPAPWISALAQGQAMSLLTRAYSTTRQERYLRAAVRALRPFRQPTDRGGVLGNFNGDVWYEEYPTSAPMHVLNGFEFTLIGLHDLEPHSAKAGILFARGVRSLERHIAVFDCPLAACPAGASEYYAATGSAHLPTYNSSYASIVAHLTATLGRITGNRKLTAYGQLWRTYVSGTFTS